MYSVNRIVWLSTTPDAVTLGLCLCALCNDHGRVSHFFSLRESLFYGSGVLAKVRDVDMREFYAGYRLSSVTIMGGANKT